MICSRRQCDGAGRGPGRGVGVSLGPQDLVEDERTRVLGYDDCAQGEAPFVAGELLHGGACEGHNVIISQLPENISNTYVVSAEGLNGVDQYHFDSAGVRTIGQRYGEAMIGVLGLDP